jgi:hypothetical protein
MQINRRDRSNVALEHPGRGLTYQRWHPLTLFASEAIVKHAHSFRTGKIQIEHLK